MEDEKRTSSIWEFVGRLKIILDLIVALIVVAPILLAGWGLIQNGINAVVPAWFVIVTAVCAGLLGYWFGGKTLFTSHKVIYDGRRGMKGFDFKGVDAIIPNDSSKDIGYGKLRFENGVLILERLNKGGRYELHLTNYAYKRKRDEIIPKNPLISGKRELRVSFDAKVTQGRHTVDFVIRSLLKGEWLEHRAEWIDQDRWTHFDWSFKIPSSEDCCLRIDDRDVTEIGSSLHLKDLLLIEV